MFSVGKAFRAVTMTVLVAQFAAVSARAQSDCDAFYAMAVKNSVTKEDSLTQLDTVFDLYCEKNGERKSNTSSNDAEVSINSLNWGGSGNVGSASTSSEERVQNFCKQYSAVRWRDGKSTYQASTTVLEAIAGYNECRKLNNANIQFEFKVSDDSVTLKLTPNATAYIDLLGVKSSANLSCIANGQSPVEIGSKLTEKTQWLNIRSVFSVHCARTAETDSNSTALYRRAHLDIVTNHAILQIRVPEDNTLSRSYSDNVDARIRKLEQDLKSQREDSDKKLATDLAAAIAQLTTTIAQVEQQGTDRTNWLDARIGTQNRVGKVGIGNADTSPQQYCVKFAPPFDDLPHVIVTPNTTNASNDLLIANVTKVAYDEFCVNIFRPSGNGGYLGWGASHSFEWIAGKREAQQGNWNK